VDMDLVIKLNSEVAGKDKLARLLQYACRALWDSLSDKNDTTSAFIHQLKSLEYILSSFRKSKLTLSRLSVDKQSDEVFLHQQC
jgi:peroxin-11B